MRLYILSEGSFEVRHDGTNWTERELINAFTRRDDPPYYRTAIFFGGDDAKEAFERARAQCSTHASRVSVGRVLTGDFVVLDEIETESLDAFIVNDEGDYINRQWGCGAYVEAED